jgi:histidinol-phosphatase (PHP family)
MAGLEIDYIHNLMGPADPKWHDSSLDLDYRIGAVHYPGLWPVSHIGYWLFGDPDEYACEGIENYFGGTPKNMVLHYYHLVSEMCDQGGFDIVAHLDFVKINNRDGKYFDEHSHWYRNAVFETLGIIAERDLLIEVNTGGKARGYRHDLYPSLEILRMAKMKGIRIVVNSDAHCPEMIDAYFPEALETLLEAGYKEKFVLHNKHWIPVPIK